MRFKRALSTSLRQSAAHFPAIMLTGARQSGKTTLLREVFPAHRYVSLDLPSAAEQAELRPGDFLAAFPPPVIVDEIQYAPRLFRHLKVAIDANRHVPGQFILTGSQKFTLMKEVADSPTYILSPRGITLVLSRSRRPRGRLRMAAKWHGDAAGVQVERAPHLP